MNLLRPVSAHRSQALLLVASVFIGGVSAAPALRAEIGREGDFSLGVERVFGFTKQTVDEDDGEFGRTEFSLLYSPSDGIYSVPRVALDYFVVDHVSLGGSVGFHTWSPSEGSGGGGGWLFSPRVGYLAVLSDVAAFWPRGGFTFVSSRAEDGDGDETTWTASAITLELPFLLMPADNIAIDIGLNLDVGVGGEVENDTGDARVSRDRTTTEIGVQAGLTAFF